MKILKTFVLATLLASSVSSMMSYADPMFRIFELGVQADKIAPFDHAAHANLVSSVSHEAGTLAMHAIRLQNQPDLAYLFEIYQDNSAYQQHIAGEYYQNYMKIAPQLLGEHKKYIATDVQFLAENFPKDNTVVYNVSHARLNFVEIWVKPEYNQAFREIVLNEMAQTMKHEQDVLAMYAVTAKDDPKHWFFIEIYADDQAYLKHREMTYFQDYLQQTQTMIEQKQMHNTAWQLLMTKGKVAFNR